MKYKTGEAYKVRGIIKTLKNRSCSECKYRRTCELMHKCRGHVLFEGAKEGVCGYNGVGDPMFKKAKIK